MKSSHYAYSRLAFEEKDASYKERLAHLAGAVFWKVDVWIIEPTPINTHTVDWIQSHFIYLDAQKLKELAKEKLCPSKHRSS